MNTIVLRAGLETYNCCAETSTSCCRMICLAGSYFIIKWGSLFLLSNLPKPANPDLDVLEDGGCLFRCPVDFVSNSCCFSQSNTPIRGPSMLKLKSRLLSTEYHNSPGSQANFSLEISSGKPLSSPRRRPYCTSRRLCPDTLPVACQLHDRASRM